MVNDVRQTHGEQAERSKTLREQLLARRAGLEAQREALVAEANKQLGVLVGQVAEIDYLLGLLDQADGEVKHG